MGITCKQIANVTGLQVDHVSAVIAALNSKGSVTRVGRSLWVWKTEITPDGGVPGLRSSRDFQRKFEDEMEVKIRAMPQPLQFRPNEKLPVHRWWPYVQGFSASFVTDTLDRFSIGRGSVVLDPFCGSGTVPVAARLAGAAGIGNDMLPLAAFVSRAKGLWEVNSNELLRAARRVELNPREPVEDPPFLRETRSHFPPRVLRSLLRLRESVGREPEGPVSTLLRLAFAEILIDSSNLKRSPCLGYAKKSGLGPSVPFRLFRDQVRRIAEDLDDLQTRRETWGPPLKILQHDSGQAPFPENGVDIAITSPPYVNGMDYPMNYKIEMAWLGLVRSYDELKRLRETMVACDNTPTSSLSDRGLDVRVSDDPWIRQIREGIRENIARKRTYRRLNMDEIVARYFSDLVPVIENVYRSLTPGARFVVVNGDSLMAGVYVPGDAIFARLARKVGFRVESFEVGRSRRSGQRRGFQLRETVCVLRRPAL